jgi:hypothetical protein
MTQEQQQEAILKAVGWERVGDMQVAPGITYPAFKLRGSDNEPVISLPNFINDLNAWYDAEQNMDPFIRLEYLKTLSSIVFVQGAGDLAVGLASAEQKAEAFLKAQNIWSE